MRQVRCIRERVGVPVGTVVDMGDDAEVSPLYYEDVEPAPPPPIAVPAKPITTEASAS